MKKENELSLPLIPVKGIVVFPHMITSFPLDKEKSIAALKKASGEYKNKVILAVQKDEPDSKENDLYKVGVVASVKQTLMLPGNSTHLIVEGIVRADITDIEDNGKFSCAHALEIPQDTEVQYDDVTEAFMRIVTDTFGQYYKLTGAKSNGQEPVVNVINATKPGQLADIICAAVTMPVGEKQLLLEMFDPIERLKYVYEKLQKELNILNLKKDIETKVKKKMEKSQRDYYLREELKVIHDELGEKDDIQDEIEKYNSMLLEKNPPQHVRKTVEKEIQRLRRIPVTTPDANVSRNYIEYILGIPWTEKTEDNKDLLNADRILDEDHYGLRKVKERIIEYLAVRMNTDETNSTILCLVGPPGVGKTSIAKSIARSLGRKYVRMSLGGVKDEAEIRGHRKTYVSAMPGRIINAMKQAGTIRHLIPKQLKENGLKRSQIKITEQAVETIITGYCREAGVRKLERTIGKLCRMAVKDILTGAKKSVRITAKNIESYLGNPKYKPSQLIDEPSVGIVRGLAWTQVGGETLLVEVNTMKGSGKLELTGNMGNVMKESAKVALSYIRSKAGAFGIDEDFYKETDISLHIPEGAVPKDGPSAGITMTTAMVSALTDKPVRNDVAMTGEVTIRGRVLAIGGLNEKVLAAKRIGITNIILPEANDADIAEMPEEIKDGMNFIYVREMSQVIENALAGGF